MHSIKIIILLIIMVIGLTACKADNPKQNETENPLSNEEVVDTLQADTYQPGEWITDYKQALKLSQESSKPILVNFTGSDWCIWCKRLSKEVFTQKAFIDYATAELILLKLDFPRSIKQTDEERKQNEALAKQFSIQGFPTVVILNKDGKEIARTGYQEGGAEKYVQHLKALIK